MEERAPPPLSPPLEGPEVGVLRSHPQPPPSHAGRVQQWVDRRESTSSPTHTHTHKMEGWWGGRRESKQTRARSQPAGAWDTQEGRQCGNEEGCLPSFTSSTILQGHRTQIPDRLVPPKQKLPPPCFIQNAICVSFTALPWQAQPGGWEEEAPRP